MDRLIEFSGNHPQLFIALGIVVSALIFSFIRTATQGFKGVSPAEATRLINHENALVLDIREARELEGGMIMDSMHIPMGDITNQIEKLKKYSDRPIIASCRSGSRSGTVCSTLVKNGFEQVYNLHGGILAWQNADLPLTRK